MRKTYSLRTIFFHSPLIIIIILAPVVTLLLQVGGIESEQSLFALASTLPLEALFLIVLAHLWMSQRSHVRFLFTWFLPCAPAIHRGKIEEQAYSPVHRL